jgi:hypothetical protein
MAAACIEQMRTIQGCGPYLLYGICSGGYPAWETAKQLVAAGEEVAGLLFYEVPLRAGFAQGGEAALPRVGRSRRYLPEPLPIDLTLLMSEGWHAQERSEGWHEVVLGKVQTVIIPGEAADWHDLYSGREATVAEQIRQWIAAAETRRRPA